MKEAMEQAEKKRVEEVSKVTGTAEAFQTQIQVEIDHKNERIVDQEKKIKQLTEELANQRPLQEPLVDRTASRLPHFRYSPYGGKK